MGKFMKKRKSYSYAPYKKRKVSSETIQKVVKKTLDKNSELKYQFTDIGGTISTTIAGTLLTGVAQGTMQNQRTGLNIEIKSIEINAHVTKADTTNLLTFWLVIEKQLAAISGLSTNFIYPVTVDGTREPAFTKYYKVLKKWRYCLNTDTPEMKLQFYKRFSKPLQLKYSAGATTDGIINRFYLIAISDSGLSTHPSITGHCLIKYTDL